MDRQQALKYDTELNERLRKYAEDCGEDAVVIFIGNATEQKLNGIEAYAVYLLHMKNAYHFGIEEEKFIGELQELCSIKGGTETNREKVVEALNHLYAMKTADFEDGKIRLREKVWGKME